LQAINAAWKQVNEFSREPDNFALRCKVTLPLSFALSALHFVSSQEQLAFDAKFI
jgi:hypothetical protein